jgi:hypothetical protein
MSRGINVTPVANVKRVHRKRNLPLALGVGFVGIFVLLAVTSIGDMPQDPAEPNNWGLPITALIVTGVPLALGFRAGVVHSEDRI